MTDANKAAIRELLEVCCYLESKLPPSDRDGLRQAAARLLRQLEAQPEPPPPPPEPKNYQIPPGYKVALVELAAMTRMQWGGGRSEERRVGKECGSRGRR